jgi:hypothetical protein
VPPVELQVLGWIVPAAILYINPRARHQLGYLTCNKVVMDGVIVVVVVIVIDIVIAIVGGGKVRNQLQKLSTEEKYKN